MRPCEKPSHPAERMVSDAGTMVDVLAARAATAPAAPAFTFAGERNSYGDVWEASGRAGGRLRRAGAGEGTRVLVALPNGGDFFAAFYGVLRIGATAVPVFPGLGPGPAARAAQRSDAALIVRSADGRAAEYAAAADIPVLDPGAWREAEPAPANLRPAPDDIAFIQFTSGTTGEPRGVQITHHNLLTNVDQLVAGMGITAADRFVSWLPVYHDMGLILMTMVPFALGAPLHLLPTRLRDPGAWLREIERTGATFTAAPDFAYRLCLRHVVAGSVNLGGLRVALNAAEPVRAATIARFEQAFGLAGVMVAGYGLAEATVGVSTWPPGSTPRVDERGFVSVGPPFPGVEVRIEAGEIQVASAATAAGYFGEPAATAEVFGADGYIRTGDLGHLDDEGNLYVVGRRKEIINVGGRSLAPAEIAAIVDDRPGVRISAAVGIDRGGEPGEQPYVFAEVRTPDAGRDDLHRIAVEIAADLWAGLGVRPARVQLLRPGSIPLTHNGKVRLGALRRRFLAGSLAAEEGVLYPG